MASYDFNDFKNACCDPSNVFISANALADADQHFNLKTAAKLLSFIHNDGLEDLRFFNTKPWENNPNTENIIMVDAYEFRTMHMLGYIAFFYNEKTKKWIIKSFKLSENRNTAMAIAMRKALCIDKDAGETNG